MNKRQAAHDEMYRRIEEHGANLNAIFHTGMENIALCKKLYRLERKASDICTRLCNDETLRTEIADYALDKINISVHKILFANNGFTLAGALSKAIFINRDPRGYALKIDDEYVRKHSLKIHQDWGGYGIIAPDFSEDNS